MMNILHKQDTTTIAFLNHLSFTNGAHILYSYNDEEIYIKNAFSFISAGLKNGHLVIFLDDKTHFTTLLQMLKSKGFKKELDRLIFLEHDQDSHNPNLLLTKLNNTIRINRKDTPFVSIWGNILSNASVSFMSCFDTYECQCHSYLYGEKALIVCAYNGAHIKTNAISDLMKNHNYLMTDTQFVVSIQGSNQSLELPSIFKQLELEQLSYENEQKYRLISENTTDFVYKFTRCGHFTYVSPSVTKLFGYEQNELIGSSIFNLIHPADRKRIKFKVFRNMVNSNFFEMDRCRIRTKNGNYIFVEFVTNSIYNPITNDVSEIIGCARDISNTIKAEVALQQSEERYRMLIENSIDAIGILKDTRWVYLNPAGLNMLGAKSFNDIKGKSILDFIHPEYHMRVLHRLKIILSGERDYCQNERKMYRLNGDLFYIEDNIVPTTYMGEPAIQIIIRDITDRKEAEKLVIQSEKLSIAGKLAAGIAHEIRNPLTALKGFLHLLKSETSSNNEVYLKIMEDELNRIEHISGELLVLAKPQAENFQEHNLIQLIEEVIILLESDAFIHGVQIVAEFKVSPLFIQCDDKQMKQVFINLIKNAIEVQKNGTITIAVQKENDHVTIQVIDEGSGIPQAVLYKVGEPFFTTKEKGTGLGIMITKRIIENHNGTLSIESEVGKGSTFTIHLPISNAQLL